MPKINKVYPPFFNGVSQQNPELILDNQCKEMENCVPDLVQGLQKRPPAVFQSIRDFTTYPILEQARVFHTYDRGEDDEEYILIATSEVDDPLQIFNKLGEPMVVEYQSQHETDLKLYLKDNALRALTVQDRTWIYSKDAVVELDYDATEPLNENYDKEAFYWLKRGSGDRYNPYNYAVYLDGLTYAVNPLKWASTEVNPPVGAEDTNVAAQDLANKINGVIDLYAHGSISCEENTTQNYSFFVGKGLTLSTPQYELIVPDESPQGTYKYVYSGTVNSTSYDSVTGMYTVNFTNTSAAQNSDDGTHDHYIDATFDFKVFYERNTAFAADVEGSLLRIYRTDGADFTYSTWDSWGDQASEGWKGSVNKITDLPKEMPFTDVAVLIQGDTNNKFTDYFVKWNGSSWEECLDPKADRGQLSNMPIKMDRTALDPQTGVATFKIDFIDWSLPRVGNDENNPDPSFVGRTIQDMFFYKNRLGLASEDSIALSEAANYTNFYATTALDIIDTDMIDITISTNQASKIYYAKPFNNSLYIFTKYAQYELVSEGVFGPATISFSNTTNYPMAIDVEPVVVNDSLFFVSTTDNRQQLREYINTEALKVKGVDLNVSTPTYMDVPVKKLVADGVLGYVLCCTDVNTVYLYNFKEDGQQRIQSAWSTWTLLDGLTTRPNSYEYFELGSTLLVICKTQEDYRYHRLQLDYDIPNGRKDTSSDGTTTTEYPFMSSIKLPDYYPQLTGIRTPKNKMLIKKVTIEGEGSFDAEVYRKDYDTTYTKSSTSSLRDLDLHIASKVGNVDITIKDSSENDFVISSIVVEGLYSATSREMK